MIVRNLLPAQFEQFRKRCILYPPTIICELYDRDLETIHGTKENFRVSLRYGNITSQAISN